MPEALGNMDLPTTLGGRLKLGLPMLGLEFRQDMRPSESCSFMILSSFSL